MRNPVIAVFIALLAHRGEELLVGERSLEELVDRGHRDLKVSVGAEGVLEALREPQRVGFGTLRVHGSLESLLIHWRLLSLGSVTVSAVSWL